MLNRASGHSFTGRLSRSHTKASGSAKHASVAFISQVAPCEQAQNRSGRISAGLYTACTAVAIPEEFTATCAPPQRILETGSALFPNVSLAHVTNLWLGIIVGMISVWLLKRDLLKFRCVLTRKAERLVVYNVLRVALVADLHDSPSN